MPEYLGAPRVSSVTSRYALLHWLSLESELGMTLVITNGVFLARIWTAIGAIYIARRDGVDSEGPKAPPGVRSTDKAPKRDAVVGHQRASTNATSILGARLLTTSE